MFNPNEHMMTLKGKDYLQVAWRLVWFRDAESGCPGYGIETELLEHGDDWAVFRCRITDQNGRVISTGHGSESRKDFGDYLEKAETKAVGRALAMLGFGTQFAADELDEGERIVDSPIARNAKALGEAKKKPNTNKTCADCGNDIMMLTKKDGTLWKSDEIAAYSLSRYGRRLCGDCMKKAEAALKTAEEVNNG